MKTLVFASLSLVLTGAAFAQFQEGRTYHPTTNTNPVTVVTGTNLTRTIPAYNASPTDVNNLQSLYGSSLGAPGANKATLCESSPTPTNAYLKEECNAMNFVRGNNATRMHVTIDPVTEPALVNGRNATQFPGAHTAGTPNISGTFTACTTSTSSTPTITNYERCEIGNEVTEGSCTVPLVVTVEWAVFNNQPNADLTHSVCPIGEFRGDQSPYPSQSSYASVIVPCDTYGLGTGDIPVIRKTNCDNSVSDVGYNTRACQRQAPTPVVTPTLTYEVCHDAALTNQNCFNSVRRFTTKVSVPLISEHKDFAACGAYYQHQAVIR